jgi:hypothetical protein
MKKLAFILALLCTLGCANAVNLLKAKYKLSIDSIVEECLPAEEHTLLVFRTSFLAFRYNECLGVEELFVIMWAGEHTEFEEKLSDLLLLEYLRQHNEHNKEQLGHVYVLSDRDEETELNAKFWYFLPPSE